MELRKIIVPVDFSEHARAALTAAIDLGKPANATIHLLHSYPIFVADLSPYGYALPANLDRDVREAAACMAATLETAARVGDWIEGELERLRPERFLLTFFGGEPLLNLPVMYALSERLWHASNRVGTPVSISIITNGLLLTEEVVDEMLPYGFKGAKITLDGDRDTHNRLRPLRGGQGTFDRIIENIRRVAHKCAIAIGGNFDETSADSYPALLDFLKVQDFADTLVKVNFKPIVRNPETPAATVPTKLKGMLPLIPVAADGRPLKPLGGTCMTAAGDGGGILVVARALLRSIQLAGLHVQALLHARLHLAQLALQRLGRGDVGVLGARRVDPRQPFALGARHAFEPAVQVRERSQREHVAVQLG